MKATLAPEQDAEMDILEAAYIAVTRRAAEAIVSHGVDSSAFIEAEENSTKIVQRMKEILGVTG